MMFPIHVQIELDISDPARATEAFVEALAAAAEDLEESLDSGAPLEEGRCEGDGFVLRYDPILDPLEYQTFIDAAA
jgi:hypothetical protein